MAQIILENLSKHFGAVKAVDQIDLNVKDGEFFALLGPSGCGKTTTLRMIAGLEVPTQGKIYIGEKDVTEESPRDRDVAMVFQDYALYPHMTILDNIGYPLKVRGVSKSELRVRVTEAAKSLNIDHLLERRPGQLSGGQQQRASVARSIVHHAQVFLFDEPLSNLDAKLRLDARGFLKHLQNELGITAVYVTHDQAEAMALANRMAIMDRGKVIQVGRPQEIYSKPKTVFVASFLGNPPMNLLPCKLDLLHKQVLINGNPLNLENVPQWKEVMGKVIDGEDIVLGIRPENITLHTEKTPMAFPGDMYVTQPLGAETLLSLLVGDCIVSVRLFTDEPFDYKGRIWIQPDPRRIFLYNSSGDLLS